ARRSVLPRDRDCARYAAGISVRTCTTMSRDPMLDRLATPASPEPASSGAACAPPSYAELHCITNFTFLRGASHPQEVVERACELGYSALAITDECSVGGVVRAHMAAKDRLKLLVGSEFRLACGLRFVALAIDRR